MIRTMTIEDYDQVHASVDENHRVLAFAVWMIPREGVERFLEEKSNDQCGCSRRMVRLLERFYVDMMEDEAVSIMSVWMRHTG